MNGRPEDIKHMYNSIDMWGEKEGKIQHHKTMEK